MRPQRVRRKVPLAVSLGPSLTLVVRTFDRRLKKAPFRDIACYRCGEPVVSGAIAVESLLLGAFEDELERDAAAVVDAGSFDPATLERDGEESTPADFGRTINNTAWHHVECALDVDLRETTTLLQQCKTRDGELERIYKIALERRRVGNAIARARAGGANVSDTAVERVEPARDRKGRPRVSVVAIGSGAASTSWVGFAMDAAMHDGAIASPLREYVFHTFAGGMIHDVATDPSQPIVATIFISIAAVRIVKAQREKLAALRAIHAPTPKLWIIGREVRDAATLDKKVLELRTELDRAGFSGDEASVLATQQADEEALRSLVAMLDDERTSSATKHKGNTFETRLALVEKALADREPEQAAAQLAPFLGVVAQDSAEHRKILGDEGFDRLVAASYRALPLVATRRTALAILGSVSHTSDSAAIASCARAMLDEPGRAMPKDFELAATVLERWNSSSRWNLYADVMLDPRSAKLRRDAVARKLNQCRDRAVAEQLLARSEALANKDPRKKELVTTAAIIVANAEQDERAAAKRAKAAAKEEAR